MTMHFSPWPAHSAWRPVTFLMTGNSQFHSCSCKSLTLSWRWTGLLHTHILHTCIQLKLQSYHHQSTTAPPCWSHPLAGLFAGCPTRPSLWDRSGWACAPGWRGRSCARSGRPWPAAGPSRGARRSRPCSRGTRARWAPAGWGSAAWAGSWPAPLAARCCCRCWSSGSWDGSALRERRLWLAGWVRAGSGARQPRGGLKRGVRASEEILTAGSERDAEKLHHIRPPIKKLSYPKLNILNFMRLLHF